MMCKKTSYPAQKDIAHASGVGGFPESVWKAFGERVGEQEEEDQEREEDDD